MHDHALLTSSFDAGDRTILRFKLKREISLFRDSVQQTTSITLNNDNLERVTGIEPVWVAWKATARPLGHTR